jgi:phosphoribosylaminoimidazole-succinocarboxamide synthase
MSTSEAQDQVLLKTDIRWDDAPDPFKRKKIHEGKVRDTYYSYSSEDRIVVTTDRVSAFDVVMPFGIPGKGAILNMLSIHFMQKAHPIVPCWVLGHGVPHPQVSIGVNCKPFKIEMIVRGYLCGSAWRAYKKGIRVICGVTLPDGLKENDKLPRPIITPTTKADIGRHDEDITPQAIVDSGLCTEIQYYKMAAISLELFEMGSYYANEAAMILVDTKFEFGLFNGQIYLIDELLTPDSSRYFDRSSYNERQPKGESQEDLSKEYLRKLLMSRGFEGKEGQVVPEITKEEVNEISLRYTSVYERLVGQPLFPRPTNDPYRFDYFNMSSTEEAVKDGVGRWFNEHRADR